VDCHGFEILQSGPLAKSWEGSADILVSAVPINHHFTSQAFEKEPMAPITITQWSGWAMLLWLSLISSLLYWMVTLLKGPKSSPRVSPKDSNVNAEPKAYPQVEPLPDFEWQQKEPVKIRPFKPKYNLTMSTRFAKIYKTTTQNH
jgi:hypothetical protein